MLTVDDFGQIRRAHRDGMTIRAIARTFHHSRRKIRDALASCGGLPVRFFLEPVSARNAVFLLPHPRSFPKSIPLRWLAKREAITGNPDHRIPNSRRNRCPLVECNPSWTCSDLHQESQRHSKR